MQQVLASDRVRLEQDIPELELFRGAVGVVVSTWLFPNTAYEVEFEVNPQRERLRILLLQQQVGKE
ncbi:MAG TPA: DUF4926 domain-containing protein [Tepidisphaeraceae bacterium]|jgi:hypothetical protein|nr:DUF4926 domain-containing protein [Tepidisphaeraceae bacterium]